MEYKTVAKTTFLVFSIILTFCSHTRAQISLNSTSFATVGIGTDSLRLSLHNASLPVLPPTAGGTWDLSGIVDSLTYFWTIRVPSLSHQYADSNKYTIGAYSYRGNAGVNITGGGILEYDIDLTGAQYDLFFITSSFSDSLIIPEQTVTYSSPLVHIGFPATYGSVWQSDYTSTTVYELTVATFSYVHKPFVRRTYTQRKDTVRGWGVMRVRNAAGLPSDYFNVLQVHSTCVITDSFFVDGLPVMPTVLAMFSLQQGKKDTSYTQRYYRAQEVTPLATVTYRDAGYTQPVKATTHIQRLIIVSVDEVTNGEEPRIYPNPTSDGTVYLANLPTTGACGYTLTDVIGNQICMGMIDKNELPNRLLLPRWVTNGNYILRISNSNRLLGTYRIHINQ